MRSQDFISGGVPNFKPRLFSISADNHGYKNLAKQPSWRSILFCVHEHIHRSKTAAMFAQFLPSLLERDSTNERSPWFAQNAEERVESQTVELWTTCPPTFASIVCLMCWPSKSAIPRGWNVEIATNEAHSVCTVSSVVLSGVTTVLLGTT